MFVWFKRKHYVFTAKTKAQVTDYYDGGIAVPDKLQSDQ